MYIIFDGGASPLNLQFYFQGNEDHDDGICKRHELIPLKLDFFAGDAGDKTEPATPKKLEDARKEGQVAKSKEVANAAGLLSVFVLLKVWVGSLGVSFLESFNSVYGRIPEIAALYGGTNPITGISVLLRSSLLSVTLMLLPPLLVGFTVAFVSDLVQVKWRPTFKPLKPKFNRLSPISGFKRIFSAHSLVELLKSIIKIGLIGYIAYSYVIDKVNIIYNLYDISLYQAVALIGKTVTDLGIRISAIYIVVAAADFAYQKYKFTKDMRMSKQEVKDEYKNSEGNPEIKGRIRSKMREASQRRMMQSVPKADVVITNPTHFAVALRYDQEEAPAPVVIAKGSDYLAARIKEVARGCNIEIYEDKPLARMLYANVEIGSQVPPELYQAVAEVLAFVYHAQGRV